MSTRSFFNWWWNVDKSIPSVGHYHSICMPCHNKWTWEMIEWQMETTKCCTPDPLTFHFSSNMYIVHDNDQQWKELVASIQRDCHGHDAIQYLSAGKIKMNKMKYIWFKSVQCWMPAHPFYYEYAHVFVLTVCAIRVVARWLAYTKTGMHLNIIHLACERMRPAQGAHRCRHRNCTVHTHTHVYYLMIQL